MAAAATEEIEITAYSQPLHTVCPIYRDAFGRTLVISPQVVGRDLQLGPLKATKEELRIVLPSILSAAGFEIRRISETVDMLEQVRPTPVTPDEPAPQRIVLRYASAPDVVAAFPVLFGGVLPSAASTPANAPAGQQTQTGAVPPAPVSVQPSLTAAPDNSLHFNGTRSQFEVVRSFVETMDVPSRLVSIRAIIGHVQLGGEYQTGLDWLTALDDSTVGNAGRSAVELPARSAARALTVYGSFGSFSRYLKLSEEDKQFRTDSRPSLFVRSGSSAEITTGERVAYPQTVLTTSNGQASTSATVAYQDVLLRLKVEAVVNSQDQITLRITQTNDTVTGTTTISGNQVPNIASQTLTTEVLCTSGQTIALGGIVTTSTTGKQRGVSGLRRMPLLGRLFDVRSKGATEEELVVLLEASLKQ